MKKSLVVTLLIVMGAAAPWAATAQDCKYHNVNLDFRSGSAIDPGIYDWCFGGIKAKGTINGEYTVCWYEADLRSSDSIYGDGFTLIETSYYYSWIETKKGDLHMREWGWWDGDYGLETGFSKVVVGSTGDFEGAIGTLSWTPRFPNLGGVSPLEGYVCTP